jgi:hypothetical protein
MCGSSGLGSAAFCTSTVRFATPSVNIVDDLILYILGMYEVQSIAPPRPDARCLSVVRKIPIPETQFFGRPDDVVHAWIRVSVP